MPERSVGSVELLVWYPGIWAVVGGNSVFASVVVAVPDSAGRTVEDCPVVNGAVVTVAFVVPADEIGAGTGFTTVDGGVVGVVVTVGGVVVEGRVDVGGSVGVELGTGTVIAAVGGAVGGVVVGVMVGIVVGGSVGSGVVVGGGGTSKIVTLPKLMEDGTYEVTLNHNITFTRAEITSPTILYCPGAILLGNASCTVCDS